MTRRSTFSGVSVPSGTTSCSSSTRSRRVCSASGHVADLIEEQRATGGLQDLALHAFLARAREGAGSVAEQLALDQRFGNRRAIEGDEVLRRAVAGRVQCAREHFLAGAGGALDHDRTRATSRCGARCARCAASADPRRRAPRASASVFGVSAAAKLHHPRRRRRRARAVRCACSRCT